MKSDLRDALEIQHPNNLSEVCHTLAAEKGFWNDFRPVVAGLTEKEYLRIIAHLQKTYMLPVKLMLVASELGEAMEAQREGDTEHVAEEIADIFIRLYDLCGGMGIDIEKEVREKFLVNVGRPEKHGKRY